MKQTYILQSLNFFPHVLPINLSGHSKSMWLEHFPGERKIPYSILPSLTSRETITLIQSHPNQFHDLQISTIAHVQAEGQDLQGSSPNQERLIFNGRQLELILWIGSSREGSSSAVVQQYMEEAPSHSLLETDSVLGAQLMLKAGDSTSLNLIYMNPAMDFNSSHTLILGGKSTAENEITKSIKSTNALKLLDNGEVSIHLQSELERPLKEDEYSFSIDSFMNFLSTNQFGRFLIWSPGLPSTHDVVSRNFCELPIGTVCVADVQSRGRGLSKNVWDSPIGCLMFSFNVQMEDGRTVPLL
ncbi:biotin--protein ligase 1, chloroplastic-like [Juglans microcarpa x Juglans regia]|uniref:biotin--protein ligase 1, chloroplastic-like n=1 Tax=Juglans microcarpa x Juglans regia TaxID=2249226 RepID=UPI001B7E5303|nr:biotin--protein ligase 1, chloroplastic-like [Juglans microcarpa x Juglans regia]